MADNTDEGLDKFELLMAMMLGLGAMGAAWAAFQGDLWGGKQAEEYGLASKEMARAAATMSEAAAQMGEASSSVTAATSGVTQILSQHSHNTGLDVKAKEHLMLGFVAKAAAQPAVAPAPDAAPDAEAAPPLETEKHYYIAKYLYAVQLDAAYYQALGFPPEYRGADKFEAMPDEILERFGAAQIPDAIVEKLLVPSARAFTSAETTYKAVLQKQAAASAKQAEADRHFEAGGEANTIGDNLGITGVLYTAALFLAGVGLVFRSNVRWGFAGLGFLALVGATVHLFLQQWAGLP